MQPTQIAEGTGITTRQRKRVSSETHHGPGTPEVDRTGFCVLFYYLYCAQIRLGSFQKWIRAFSP
jgi:hypothetical protein